MRDNKKAQLSIETMIIYGLVILVALSVVGGLLYFDVLDVASYLPEECDLGSSDLACEEFALSSTDNRFEMGIRNIGQRGITNVLVTVSDETGAVFSVDDEVTGELTESTTIGPGAIGKVAFDDLGEIEQGALLRGTVVVSYEYVDGAIEQESIGSIRVTAS